MKTTALPFGLSLLRSLPFPRKLGILERIYGKSLSKKGLAWVNTSTGIDWKLDLGNPCHRWIVYGDYEGPAQMNWIRNWMSAGGTVIDSGASIGQTLIYFLSVPGTRVICIEPVPTAVEWLRECIAQGGFTDRTTVLDFVLVDHEGVIQLKVAGPGNSSEWSTVNLHWFEDQQTRTISCIGQTLDNLLQLRDEPTIRLWKLDVEGGEEGALHGATRSLLEKRIEAVLIELNHGTLDDVISFMREHGFEPHEIRSRGETVKIREPRRQDLGGRNCLFLPA
jgi:FkbM family methyltransferase